MTEETAAPTLNAIPAYDIPSDLIDKWVNIPVNQAVKFTLTRGDVDHLYFGIKDLVYSVATIRLALNPLDIKSDRERVELLNSSYNQAQTSINHIAQLLQSIMQSSVEKAD